MPINSWSYSRLAVFEKCKHRAFLQYDAKIPEPERALRPGQLEHANDRGSRVHDALEQYTRGKSKDYPEEAKHFRMEVDILRDRFEADASTALFEEDWAFDAAWEPAPWTTGWLRLKLDALLFLSPYEAIAIDYKTGKKFGNELAHAQQLQLYALACFLRFPHLEHVDCELWYLDQDDLTTQHFTRHQGLRFKQNWDRRGTAVTTALDFPPNANRFSCQYCPYGKPENGFPNGTGHCAAGRK